MCSSDLLSTGCEGFVHQFALATGVPHFCHVRDLNKSVSFTLPGGKIVHRTLRRPMSSHHCDSHMRSAEDSTSGGAESTTMDGGMHPAPPKLAYVPDTSSHVNMHAGASRDDPRRSSRTAARSVNKLAALAAEEGSRAASAAKAAEDELRANTMTRLVDSLKGLLDTLSDEQKSSISGMLLSCLGGVESKKRRGGGGGGRVASPLRRLRLHWRHGHTRHSLTHPRQVVVVSRSVRLELRDRFVRGNFPLVQSSNSTPSRNRNQHQSGYRRPPTLLNLSPSE